MKILLVVPHFNPRERVNFQNPVYSVPLALATVAALTPSDVEVDIWDEAVFGQIGTIGGHSNGPPGVLILHGPGIKRNHEIHDVHVNDLMPTISYIRGLDVARDWAGRVLLEALEGDAQRPVGFVDSYGLRAAREQRAPDQNSRTLELQLRRLRSLGYIR